MGITVASMYSTTFSNFQANCEWLMWVCISLLIVSEIAILCFKPGRRAPWNYLLLLVFTLCEAYMVSFICSVVGQESGKAIVLMAAIMTLGTSGDQT